jgi:hypothetical protein
MKVKTIGPLWLRYCAECVSTSSSRMLPLICEVIDAEPDIEYCQQHGSEKCRLRITDEVWLDGE